MSCKFIRLKPDMIVLQRLKIHLEHYCIICIQIQHTSTSQTRFMMRDIQQLLVNINNSAPSCQMIYVGVNIPDFLTHPLSDNWLLWWGWTFPFRLFFFKLDLIESKKFFFFYLTGSYELSADENSPWFKHLKT